MVSAGERRQQKAAKKKIAILIFMALATAMTWGKTLFGKDDKSADPPAVAATPIPGAAGGAGPVPAGPRTATVATTTSSSISSYAQAVQRMTTWPNALKRRVHVGQIEEIVPFESETLDTTNGLADPGSAVTVSQVDTALPPPVVEPGIRFKDLHLKLTTTAIFGKSRYARINGEKVIPGQNIEVQVGSETIRYEVSAINTREVEIRYSGETYILRIAASSLLGGVQDGA